jgi:hypothetical protein
MREQTQRNIKATHPRFNNTDGSTLAILMLAQMM